MAFGRLLIALVTKMQIAPDDRARVGEAGDRRAPEDVGSRLDVPRVGQALSFGDARRLRSAERRPAAAVPSPAVGSGERSAIVRTIRRGGIGLASPAGSHELRSRIMRRGSQLSETRSKRRCGGRRLETDTVRVRRIPPAGSPERPARSGRRRVFQLPLNGGQPSPSRAKVPSGRNRAVKAPKVIRPPGNGARLSAREHGMRGDDRDGQHARRPLCRWMAPTGPTYYSSTAGTAGTAEAAPRAVPESFARSIAIERRSRLHSGDVVNHSRTGPAARRRRPGRLSDRARLHGHVRACTVPPTRPRASPPSTRHSTTASRCSTPATSTAPATTRC